MSAATAPLPLESVGPDAAARLRALAERSPWTRAVTANRAYRLAAVQLPAVALVVPLLGTKRVELGGETFTARPGEAMVLHERAVIDTENLPGEEGRFVAISLFFSERAIEGARAIVGSPASAGEARVTRGPLAPLEPAVAALLRLPAEAEAPAVERARVELAMALYAAGHARFLAPRPPRLAERARDLLAEAPARPWTAAELASALELSEAALRRGLAAEGSTVRRLLAEVRAHHGLGLIQTTGQPLAAVARACGYRTAASLRARFHARFGVGPGAVRASPPTAAALADAAGGV